MNLPVLFTLNNPMIAPIMVMIACFALGGVVAYIVLVAGRKRFVYRSIEHHTKGALRTRDAHIRRLNKELDDLSARNGMLKAKIGTMALFLGKAIAQAEIDG